MAGRKLKINDANRIMDPKTNNAIFDEGFFNARPLKHSDYNLIQHAVKLEQMSTRIYHGNLDPRLIANRLTASFSRGNFLVQQVGNPENLAVQIATRPNQRSGGRTAMTANISRVEDGISITLGEQNWFGLAASLGLTALSAVRNPLSLLGRLDDIAQDVESIMLEEQIWEVIDQTARQHGTGQALSARLSRTVCPYCLTANEIGAGRCLACGAPLGEVQPASCQNCGFVVSQKERVCPNCKARLSPRAT